MPGISLISSSGTLSEKKNVIEDTLNSLNVLNGYTSNQLFFEDQLFLGWNKYEKYPIEIFNFDKFTILIEGKIYNKDIETLKRELFEITKIIIRNDAKVELKTWLLTNDGDFIIYFVENELKNIYIINDIFGRLPLYYSKQNENIIFSRYLKFITELDDNSCFDRLAIAQFLLIGYMLGKRTLFENIYQVRPASFIKIENSTLEITILHEFNFDNREHIEATMEQNVSELSKLFSTSCYNRTKEFSENIVTLSGGLDSRLVASCMSKNQIPFKVATIDYKSGKDHDEIDISLKLSKLFNVHVEVIPTPNPSGSDVYDLLRTKEGMVSFTSTPILPFYKGIIKAFGSDVHYISGDNGDKVIFTYDKPIKKNSSVPTLVENFIQEYSLISIENVSKITSVDKKDILREFEIIFDSFPEANLVQKYIHFKAIEKPFKSAFYGEDRHRHFFWNSSPFWSYPFFNYIMGIPENSKKMHRLFRKLLNGYSIEATNLPYTNFKSSINSILGKSLMWLIFYFYPLFPFAYIKKIKSLFFGGISQVQSDHIVKKCIVEQIENVKEIQNYFKTDELIPFLSDISSTNLYNFFTITSSIELFQTKMSIVEKKLENEFT
jgi:asparagine synthase (glutamine-hydrolysing)